MEEKKTYEASVKELETLVERIEDPNRTFAETMEDIRRGRELVEQCREMLRTTESVIAKQ
ncbi:MAG: exodeoxyribonuclease VII small subunit [Bacteroidales bacterium]|jgi:exodeoxyribonuclease VII small subunit|nr:exodeoxyribonuclease VII small subunit [Bacteroidales bacterium]